MNVVHVAAECAPFAKAGGLGDVAAALPVALGALGHRTLTVLPLYRSAAAVLGREGLKTRPGPEASLPVGRGHRVRTHILERPDGAHLFLESDLYDRPGLYGYEDEAERFAVLSLAALEAAGQVLGAPVDIFHAHDWHAGLLPHYLRRYRRAHPTARSVFTIHNLGYQGTFGASAIRRLCLDERDHTLDGYEFHGGVSFMKAGITASDAITTVSPRYAQEILTPSHGFQLDGLLRHHRSRLHGIVNGLDVRVWDPASDALLARNFDATSRPAGKADNRRALFADLGVADEGGAMLLGVVSRLTAQKGLDLLADLVPALHGLGVRVVLLGSGEPAIEERLRELARVFSHNLTVRIGFDEGLAHRIVAASDAMAVPSRFEPCGLTQLQAMRYGALPIVHATGGLADTVRHLLTGFVFEHPTASGLRWALGLASRCFHEQRASWDAMSDTAMAQDLSWEASAREYAALYQSLLSA